MLRSPTLQRPSIRSHVEDGGGRCRAPLVPGLILGSTAAMAVQKEAQKDMGWMNTPRYNRLFIKLTGKRFDRIHSQLRRDHIKWLTYLRRMVDGERISSLSLSLTPSGACCSFLHQEQSQVSSHQKYPPMVITVTPPSPFRTSNGWGLLEALGGSFSPQFLPNSKGCLCL